MSRDHWTAEEYREFLRTGQEPGEVKLPHISPPAYPLTEEEEKEIIKKWADEHRTMKNPEEPKAPKRKYRNEPVAVDGIRFASKHEAAVYGDLTRQVQAGILKCVCRQVGFDLPGGIRYFADFVVIYPDNHIEVLDAKSAITRKNRVYINKKKQLKAVWDIDIVEV